MQSLMSMKAYVGTRLPILTNSETSTRKQRVNCPNRRNVMVSCGSERNGNEGIGSNSGSFMSPSHNYAILKHRMEKAAKSEVSVFVFFFFLRKENVFFFFYIINEVRWWFLGFWRGASYFMEFEKRQYYEEASRIRDSLKCFEDEIPVLRLRRLLKEAVADERFQVAILLLIFLSIISFLIKLIFLHVDYIAQDKTIVFFIGSDFVLIELPVPSQP